MVGLGRLELPTSRLSSARSNQLSYKPGFLIRRTAAPPAQSCATTSGTGLVREERETKTAVSCQWAHSILKRMALMFPRDPIEDA